MPKLKATDNPALTERRERFAQLVFSGKTQKDAFIEVFGQGNMSKNTISTQSSKLMKHPVVIQRLLELRSELQEKNIDMVSRVLEELSHIAFDDIKNYLQFRQEKVVVGYDEDNHGAPIYEYRTIIDLKPSADVDTRAISEVSIAPNGTFKFKLYPKDAALIQMGKHLGLFNEKVELTGKDGGPVAIEDARRLLAERIAKIRGT